jgi:multidrug efflux pump subunit AcrB
MRVALDGIEGIESVLVVGGSTPTGDRDIRRASFTIILERLDNGFARKFSDLGQQLPLIGPLLPQAPANGRIRPQNEIEAEVFQRLVTIPDVRAFKLNDRGERDISFSILSSSEADLNLAVQRLEEALSGDPLLANVASEGALPRPEIQITPRMDEAARLGVTTQQIASVVRVATIGAGQAECGQSADPGQGAAERCQPREPGAHLGAEDPHCIGGLCAAVGGGRYPDRRRPQPG